MNKSKLFFVAFLLWAVIIPFSCVEEEEPLLNVHVDFSINLLNYPVLNSGMLLLYPHVGYHGNGVIIFPTGFSDEDEFRAYDATCTSDICTRNISEKSTAVKADGIDGVACPKCKTAYKLYTGYAVNENFHLQQYAARRDGANRLYITNR